MDPGALPMITVISATNRTGSNTLKVATIYRDQIRSMGIEAALLSLEGLDLNGRSPGLEQIEDTLLIPSNCFVFILPEYNGSFPGSVKTVLDMSRYRECWWNKKALLTGVADGRAGNLRGMDHFTGVLNYLRMLVHPNKLPISMIDQVMDGSGKFTDPATWQAVLRQITEFLEFCGEGSPAPA
ncbi:MAG TPA: NADPH-dependent FMN reductase, partial [Chitinophagaceae bacterium]|nr:NADPH-dependent FMN reductase [Chitinophagaceae bacterium]